MLGLLNGILSESHLKNGLYLLEDEDYVELYQDGCLKADPGGGRQMAKIDWDKLRIELSQHIADSQPRGYPCGGYCGVRTDYTDKQADLCIDFLKRYFDE